MAAVVYLRGALPLPGGTIDYPVPFAVPIDSGVDSLNLGTHEGLAYLLRVDPFDPTKTIDLPMPLPGGEIDLRSSMHTTIQGATTTIYPAATVSRSTAPDDVPPNLWVPGRFDGAINYELQLFDGADPTSGISYRAGNLDIEDPEGELDGLRGLGWDAAALTILRGDPSAPFSTFQPVARMTTAGLLYDVRRKQLNIRDLAWVLTQAELHGNRYGGTGGLDGDASLAGVIKPYAIGKVFNVTPKAIDAANLIYQVSCSSIRGVDAVRDGGIPLAGSTNRSTYESLVAFTVPPGHYATCLAAGLIKVGSTPQFDLTVDLDGDNDVVNGHTYPSTRAQIARRIATARGSFQLDDVTQIDGRSYRDLEQYQPATLGYFWDSEITKADALTEVMRGCLGWWIIRINGRLAFGQISDPAYSSPNFSLEFPSRGSGEVRVGELAMTDYKPPRRQTQMGWAKNYTVRATSQLATSVPVDLQAIYGAETRYTVSVDPWVAVNYPTSPTVSVDGGFAYEADAQAEGDRQQRLLRKPRERFQLPVVMDPLSDVPARIIALQNVGRFGIDASKNFFCAGITVNGDAWPVLELYG